MGAIYVEDIQKPYIIESGPLHLDEDILVQLKDGELLAVAADFGSQPVYSPIIEEVGQLKITMMSYLILSCLLGAARSQLID